MTVIIYLPAEDTAPMKYALYKMGCDKWFTIENKGAIENSIPNV